MERTALEVTFKDTVSGEETIQFETVQGAQVVLGGGEGAPDRETPRTRFCINVDAKAFVHEDNGFTRDVHIQLWITPTQIADIVKAYFSGLLCHTGKVYHDLLERILRKRWTVMTSGLYRVEIPGTERLEPYYKVPRRDR